MTQTSNRFFDEIARLMNDAAGVAQGVRREFDTLFRTQAERWLGELDLVNPPRVAAQLAEGLSSSRMVVLPNVGHLPHIEAKTLFRQELKRFLEQVSK